jgi:hypothetical protein
MFMLAVVESVGAYRGMPQTRNHSVQLRGFTKTLQAVWVNGVKVSPSRVSNGTCTQVPGWGINLDYSLTASEGAVVVDAGRYRMTQTIDLIFFFAQ